MSTAYLKTIFVLALAGALFSGYLSAVKLFTGTCALNESCPYFLGYPACWFGFGMFLVLFVASLAALFSRASAARAAVWLTAAVSLVGVFFAGRLVWIEVAARQVGTLAPSYALGLPTCAYGLVFYAAIFVVSLLALERGAVTGNESQTL